MDNIPLTTQKMQLLSRIMFYLAGVIWLIFGLRWLYQGLPVGDIFQIYRLIITGLIFANALLLFLLGLLLRSAKKWTFILAVSVLVINIGLSFFQQFGIFDLITLLISVVLLVIMILSREAYGFARKESEQDLDTIIDR